MSEFDLTTKAIQISQSNPSRREQTIDIIRGIAIFTMVSANLGPLLEPPHTTLFRYYGSFAAPIFIVVAGMMVEIGKKTSEDHSNNIYLIIQHSIKRCLFIVGIGAILDAFVWHILPFVSFDVLYLTGIMLPFCYFLSNLKSVSIFIAAVIFIVLTPVLQKYFGYSENVPEIILNSNLTQLLHRLKDAPQHWFIDGWFPIFPWFGFGLFGILLGRLRKSEIYILILKINWRVKFLTLAAILLFSSYVFTTFSGVHFEREGYSELFYPVTCSFIFLAFSIIFTLFILIDSLKNKKILKYFSLLGEAPMLMYILHIIIIGALLGRFRKGPENHLLNPITFILVYFGIIVFLLIVQSKVKKLKTQINTYPLWIKWIIG